MTNGSELILPSGLQIETTDGQVIHLDQDANLIAHLGGAGGDGPLPRICVGKPRDSRFPDAASQLFAQRRVQAVNEEGEKERYTENIGPFGKKIIVRPVGIKLPIGLVRSYMPRYVEDADDAARKPLCHSENGLFPDPQFVGKFSTVCARFDPKTQRVVAVCPMAQWGETDPTTGKSAKPDCQEQYLILVAFEWEGQQIVAETYFKGTSAPIGKTLVEQINALKTKELPLYSYPLELFVREIGDYNSLGGRLLVPSLFEDGSALLPNEAEIPQLEQAVARAQEAFRIRVERANRIFDENGTTNSTSSEEATGVSPDDAVGQYLNPSAPVKPSAPQIPASTSKPPTKSSNKAAKPLI